MLRVVVVGLLIANLVFWAWRQPEIAHALGLPTGDQREPQRLAQQEHPEAIRVLPPPSAPVASAAASGSAGEAADSPEAAASTAEPLRACLETGSLTAAQLPLALRALQQAGVAPGGWVEMRRDLPGRWMVGMGRFADREQRARKAAELTALKLAFDLVDDGELAPGLRLGQFDSVSAAQARLAQLQNRGVRTARVLSVTAPGQDVRLRADRLADAALLSLREPAASGPPETRWRSCEP
jgi:hypothetical protein